MFRCTLMPGLNVREVLGMCEDSSEMFSRNNRRFHMEVGLHDRLFSTETAALVERQEVTETAGP